VLLKAHDLVDTCFVIERTSIPDKQPRIHLLHLPFGSEWFKGDGSLLLGELVQSKRGDWHLMLEDVFAFAGRTMKDVPLSRRLMLMSEKIDGMDAGLFGCFVSVKRHFTTIDEAKTFGIQETGFTWRGIRVRGDALEDAGTYMQLCKNRSRYENTSIVRQPRAPRRAPGAERRVFDKTLVKAKIDPIDRVFYVQRSGQPDVYLLYDTLRSADPSAKAGVQTLEQSKKMREMFEGKPITDRVKMRLIWDCNFGKWMPKNIEAREVVV
jgi:hypothetical protein